MHEVLVNRLGGLSLPRKSVVRLTDRPDMTLDVYRGRKTTMQQQQQHHLLFLNQTHTCDISQFWRELPIWSLFSRPHSRETKTPDKRFFRCHFFSEYFCQNILSFAAVSIWPVNGLQLESVFINLIMTTVTCQITLTLFK